MMVGGLGCQLDLICSSSDGISLPIGSMYAIYGNIYHQYTPNVSIYTIHGSYGLNHISYINEVKPHSDEFVLRLFMGVMGWFPSSILRTPIWSSFDHVRKQVALQSRNILWMEWMQEIL